VKGKRLRRVMLGMERWMLRRFDAVSSISNRMIERLIKKGVPKERTRFFPNWVDMSRIALSPADTGYRSLLSIPSDALVVLFSGTLGSKQGLLIIPAVAKILAERRDIVIVICGDGVLKAQLQAETASLSNVRHLSLQPMERLGELLGTADIHLLPQRPGAADLVMPSKLSGMLASGRPVIATCDPGTEIDAVVSKCGLVVPPEDSAALAAAICKLTDDPATRLALGQRARACAAANFERDAVLGRIFGPVESIEGTVTYDGGPIENDDGIVAHDAAA
jgi:colanic acid biosynthesis glycosyl transferase WcaI